MTIPVLIPLLNTNEPEALLADLPVVEGQRVQAGQALCTLETTKTTAEVMAEADGYVVGLRFKTGDTLRAGERLCYLAETPDEKPEDLTAETQVGQPGGPGTGLPAKEGSGTGWPVTGRPGMGWPDSGYSQADLPVGLRISQPALNLARQNNLDLGILPLDKIITEAMVRNTIEGLSGESLLQAGAGEFDPTALLIYGGGGHGKALIELVRAMGVYRIAGVVDDGLPLGQSILDVPVLGGQEALGELFAQGVRLAVNAVGGIGNVAIRIQVFERLTRAGFACPAVVHPRAILEPSASLAAGVQVFAQAYVGSEARIGFGSIVNTGAIVSHECQLDEFVNISPGALLAGQVQVGEAALIGMGVTINLNTKIGAGARIGNGATVKSDVPERGVVRAGSVWPD